MSTRNPPKMITSIDCPACGNSFTRQRTNQQYCSRCCQQNAARTDRFLENILRDEYQSARAADLRAMLYAAPPNERLGIMKDILDAAEHDGSLRNILTWPILLADRMGTAGRGQSNTAKAADAYTKKFFGVSITTYIRGIRRGARPLPIEIDRASNPGPVPMIKTRLHSGNVKCIHKSLPEGTPVVTEEDYERVDQLVLEAQARVDALLASPSYLEDAQSLEDDQSLEELEITPENKRESRRKLALSAACFARGVEITSEEGREIATHMGIQTL